MSQCHDLAKIPKVSLRPLSPKLAPALVVVILLAMLIPGIAFAQAAEPQATVLVNKLNVRSGPSTGYAIVTSAPKNAILSVLGKSNDDCDWLKVRTKKGREGWVAAEAKYVRLSVACSEIGPFQPPAEVPRPTTTLPKKAAPTFAELQLPPDKGCYILQNLLGAELTWTFTGENGHNHTFNMPPEEEWAYCLDPGMYDVTVDAPPPWRSINFKLEVFVGNLAAIPIQGP